MKIYHVYKRPGYDKMTNEIDEWSAGEWHYCGTWSDERFAQRRADRLVEEGTSVRVIASELNPSTAPEEVIEFGPAVHRGPAQMQAEQEMQTLKNTSPITQSPDSSPSKSRLGLGPVDFNVEEWFKFSSWV